MKNWISKTLGPTSTLTTFGKWVFPLIPVVIVLVGVTALVLRGVTTLFFKKESPWRI